MTTSYTNSGSSVTSPPDVLSSITSEASERVAADNALEATIQTLTQNVAALSASIALGASGGSGTLVTADGSSTARSIGARSADDLNVLDFGADPTGVASSTDAFNDALTEAATYTPPKRVIAPKGRYRTTGTISLHSGSWLEGRGATLVPDKTPDSHVIRGIGTALAKLEHVTVCGFDVDGVNKPVYPDDGTFPDGLQSGWAQVRFDYAQHVRVFNMTWNGVHSCLVFQNCEDGQVYNLKGHDLTDGVCTFFTGCKRFTVNNIQATNASECMDFFNDEDIVVTNVQGTGQVTPAHLNEAFDISTSRRISISNVVVTGFARGARIKSESTGSGQAAWSDISIQNMTCLDQTYEAINAQASASGYGATERLRISNVTTRSTVAGSMGFACTPDIDDGGTDCRIENCSVSVPGTGIQANGWSNLVIRNNVVSGCEAGVGIDVSFTSTHGVRIIGNDVTVTGGSSSYGAINVARSDDAYIADNVVDSASSDGIRVATATAGGKRPVIIRNTVKQAGHYGIHVVVNSASYYDPARFAEISHNDIRDWGRVAAGRLAIYVPITNVTGTIGAFNICHNTMTLPSGVGSSGSQGAITVTSGGAITLERSRLAFNTSGTEVPSTDYTGEELWATPGDATPGTNNRTGNFPDTPDVP